MKGINLQHSFNNIKIRRKLIVLSVAIICFVIVVAIVALYNEYLDNQNNFQLIEQTVRTNYDTNIKNQVENVITLLDGIYAKYNQGK